MMRVTILQVILLSAMILACSNKPLVSHEDSTSLVHHPSSPPQSSRDEENSDALAVQVPEGAPTEAERRKPNASPSAIFSGDDSAVTVSIVAGESDPLALSVAAPTNRLQIGSVAMQAKALFAKQSQLPLVEWSVDAAASADPGSISADGKYSPPKSGEGGYEVVITARLIDDPSITGNYVVNLISAD